MNTYDGFEDWADVAIQFSGTRWGDSMAKDAALKAVPEPDEVLAACYHQDSYEGDAWIVFRRGDKYFTNEGSHCSCYGLEGQWGPEEYPDAKTLLDALNKGNWDDSYGAKGRYLAMVKNILAQRVGA